ncbi:ABC transporter substrate-binding protein [Mobiluncus mulieris]|uniref:Maltodextrin-binding protein mdxE n=1 Tax=Mobiluncus mulieris TaxID=2052 RepID=A0A7Y0U6G5_9ACTO|nr:sugar ABC transporter substrate-binding protein [Mobiluncus mulieris]EEZ91424.1 ABC transporter, solute-binding protein [Mobiluncus mulieris 28-1]EFN93926.1 ABC transporter, solute-binding protein [Mobiluncus mulieris FB024-16]MBB5845468.1 multiple sugar transport system substrate-binding protein [Mobiluncus mulieris]MCU9969549.1 sugar ABC transporter substrate-binding protein [Mobiluncus mulieris]MCU9974047.1 sugar ABC transporter substrate-binding protein [Mobiluncus mulieris]
MKRTTLVAAIAASALALSLTGCGDSAKTADARTNAMYTWIANAGDRAQWQAFVDGVKQGDSKFNLKFEGPSFQEYWTKVKTRMSAADAPCIMTTQAARAQELKNLLTPLDEFVKKNKINLKEYNEAMLKGMTVDGKLRAIPYDAAPEVLYYNKDLFDKAGIKYPTTNYTWDQMVSDAKKLTNGDVYGLSFPPILEGVAAVIYANGGMVVENGKPTLTNPVTVKAVQDVFDLAAKDKVMKAPVSADPITIQIDAFKAGKAAMIIAGPWMYDSLASTKGLSLGMAVIPSRDGTAIGMVQGSGFGISENCPNKEAAFKNIIKMTTAKVMRYVAQKNGNIPAIVDAFDGWAESKDPADVEAVKIMIDNAKTFETTENWQQVEIGFTQNVSNGYTGEKTAEEILTTLQNSIK